MTLSLTLNCRNLPADAVTIPGVQVDHWDDAATIVISDIATSQPEEVVSQLRKKAIFIRGARFGGKRPPNSLPQIDKEWIGFQLIAGHLSNVDAKNEFDPKFAPPHFGVVPPNRSIHFSEPLTGHVCSDTFNHVFSKEFAEILRSFADGSFGDVFVNGKRQSKWVRFHPKQSNDVLCMEAFWPFRCFGCGTPGLSDCGTLIGSKKCDFSVCSNEQGIDHLRAVYPLIISIDVAKVLAAAFRTGYGLDPILEENSARGRRIRELVPLINEVREFRNVEV